jgi:hypothetical protein
LIRARVAELQGQGAERAVVTLETLIAEAGDIQAKALAKVHYSAAVSALTVKAKLSGHWVDRGENKTSNVVYAISDRELTEEEWLLGRSGCFFQTGSVAKYPRRALHEVALHVLNRQITRLRVALHF